MNLVIIMNLSDIAKIANVSVSTVSKALSDAKDVNIETKNKIIKIAEEYGVLNKYSGVKYKKKVIAVICPEIMSQYYSSIVESIQKSIEKRGGTMLLGVDFFNNAKQKELIEYFTNYAKVDGLIVFGLLDVKSKFEVPIVSFGSASAKADSVQVIVDDALDCALKSLKQKGHKEIAFIGEQLTKSKSDLFYKLMRKNGLIVNYGNIIESELRFEDAGFAGMRTLINNKTNATAVICAYDYIALGAIKYLQLNGYSVPEDFSVIGFDGITIDEYISKSLSTVCSHNDEAVEELIDLLYKKISNKWHISKNRITIFSEYVERDSVGFARKSDIYVR